uniref:Geranylgeranyl pyrophosphate synthase n=2 Tax=environmental samples TaxID=48479 RepID=C7FPH3_9BACT|nr:geranylgeranyl pyrophosphate synthase CrtE [uncultured bacterium HF186_25m_30B18]ACU26476.1 geranylgeranyl pyrophosphate synthase [uncultured bacterium HF186_25m_13D19]
MVPKQSASLRLVAEPTSQSILRRREERTQAHALERGLEAVRDHALQTAHAHLNEPLRSMVVQHLQTGGKQVRARIVLEAARALGEEPMTLVPIAAACELLHNATLVHDDLQDGDTVRRGEPAVWVRHGEAQAINVGDAMLMLPTLALEQMLLMPSVRWYIATAFTRRATETACGQALELELLGRGWLGRGPYLRAALGKSGPFFSLPIETAALAAGRQPTRARAIGDALLALGALFQIRDDVLDLFGDKGRGQRGNDLREGKVSALTVTHLERRPEDTEELVALLKRDRDETHDDDVAEWSERLVLSGALEDTCAWADELLRDLVASAELAMEPGLRALVSATAQTIAAPLTGLRS